MQTKNVLKNDPRARQRMRWIEHYEQVTHKVSPTARYFGITRGTFYLWYHRYLSLGVEGLRTKSCRPHKIRRLALSPNFEHEPCTLTASVQWTYEKASRRARA